MSLESAWYRQSRWLVLLRPLSLLFKLISRYRRNRLSAAAAGPNTPILVVGNISVGGTGKTPICVYLIELAQELGISVGLISRGYGGKSECYPLCVTANTPAIQAGDEPVLIARRTGIPVVVDPDRVRAAQLMAEKYHPQLIISDDGLQHYRLKRDFELVVVDSERGLGNGALLPEGPLREPVQRLNEVDLVLINGTGSYSRTHALRFDLEPESLVELSSGKVCAAKAEALGTHQVDALAGIGHPERFLDTLERLGFSVRFRALPDHAQLRLDDFKRPSGVHLLLTEKDAVKCEAFRDAPELESTWMLRVNAQFDAAGRDRLIGVLLGLVGPANPSTKASTTGEINGS